MLFSEGGDIPVWREKLVRKGMQSAGGGVGSDRCANPSFAVSREGRECGEGTELLAEERAPV